MIDVFLVPETTVITNNGDSAPADVSAAEHRIFLANLSVAAVVEQQSIELGVFTSADGATWESKPVASLPQKFYVGEYPLLVDLSQFPNARFVRAHWDVSRWGRGPSTPHFEIGIRLREISPGMLHEAGVEGAAKSK